MAFVQAVNGQSVLTQHNDNQRTGANLHESALTPATVSRSMGHLYDLDISSPRSLRVRDPQNPGRFKVVKVPNTVGAQPLYSAHVVGTDGAAHEVLYVATRQNFIFAFDVSGSTAKNFWSKPLELRDSRGFGAEELQGMDGRYQDDPLWSPTDKHPCFQTHGPVGIASTPVIDEASNTMWVVYRTSSPFGPAQYDQPGPNPYDAKFYIRKIDIRTGNTLGQEREITVPTNNPDAPLFDPNKILTRTGLLLANGVIYIGFAGAVCDDGAGEPKNRTVSTKPSTHGWVLALDANSLDVINATVTTPNTSMGGIWQSGAGLASDCDQADSKPCKGYVFALTGNNKAENDNRCAPEQELSNSILRLQLARSDPNARFAVSAFHAGNWFRLDTGKQYPGDPFATIPRQPVFGCDKPQRDAAQLILSCAGDPKGVDGDSDVASGGAVVLPSGMVLGGGKQGRFYLLSPDTMAVRQSFQAFVNSWHIGIAPCDYDEDQSFGPNIHGAPVVWHPDGVNYSLVYHMPEKDYLKAFRAFDTGAIEERPFRTTYDSSIRSPRGMPGGYLSISSSGGSGGVLWVSVQQQDSTDGLNTNGDHYGRLLAFDASTLAKLWEAADPSPVPFAKYIPPTVGGGKVFRSAYADRILVYGLNATNTGAASPLLTVRTVTATWRDKDHLDLFMAGRSQSGGSVLTANWEAVCPSRAGVAKCTNSTGAVQTTNITTTQSQRGWVGWYPVDSNMDRRVDSESLPNGYTFTSSGSAPVTSVVRPGTTHTDLFVADNQGRVMSTVWEQPSEWPQWSTRWKGTGWKAWFAIGSGSISVAARQPITAVWRNSNHLDVFAVGRDGRVMSTYFENNAWQQGWFSVAGNSAIAVAGQEVTAVWRNGQHLDLFVTGTDGRILSTYFENNHWQSGWFQVANGAARPGQPVTAVWRNSNHLDLFITGRDGKIMSTYFEGTAWQPGWFPVNQSSGTAVPGQKVTAVWRNQSHLDLFIASQDGRVMSTYFESNHWLPAWFAVSSSTGSVSPGQPVTAVWSNTDHLDLFVSAPDGRVMSTFFQTNQWNPNGWFPI